MVAARPAVRSCGSKPASGPALRAAPCSGHGRSRPFARRRCISTTAAQATGKNVDRVSDFWRRSACAICSRGSTGSLPRGHLLADAGAEFVVLPAAQAAELVLDAIARSDGTRGSVLEELRRARVKDGILGSFRFDRNGDITPARLPIFRVTGETPPTATSRERSS